jgi:hypothetical protein
MDFKDIKVIKIKKTMAQDVNYFLNLFGTTGYRPTAQDFINMIKFFAGLSNGDALDSNSIAGLIGVAQPGDAQPNTTTNFLLFINSTAAVVTYPAYVDAGGNALEAQPYTIGLIFNTGTAYAMQAYTIPSNVVQNLNTPNATQTLSTQGLEGILGALSQLATNNKSSLVAAINEVAGAQFETSVTIPFAAPLRQVNIFNAAVENITDIVLNGADSIAYSTDGGSTFTPVTLPRELPLQLPTGWVVWQITYSATSVLAGAALILAAP